MPLEDDGSIFIKLDATTYIYVHLSSNFSDGSKFSAIFEQYPTEYYKSGTTTLINYSTKYHMITLTPGAPVAAKQNLRFPSYSLVGDLSITITDANDPGQVSPPISMPVIISP